jgi:hypothetical protein
LVRRMLIGLLLGIAAAGIHPAVSSAETIDRVATEVLAARRPAWERVALSETASGNGATAAFSPALHRSTRRAFFLSLLVPGLGQRYLGQQRRSQLYLGAEVGVWIAVASFYTQGSMREDRYRDYAAIVAGADPDVDDDEYYKNLALYASSDIFARPATATTGRTSTPRRNPGPGPMSRLSTSTSASGGGASGPIARRST